MTFTGKATYSAGVTLPENAEDVADVIGIVSPFETPLLDHLGDSRRVATSTIHEWLEDSLLPNQDTIDNGVDPDADTSFIVTNVDRFRVGDQIQGVGSSEVILVTAIDTGTSTLTVTRSYGGTTLENLADAQTVNILGNAALEGDDRPAARFTNRTRQQNYTQIFTAGVEVSGSQLAARQLALADELDYQKQERLREMIRDLENSVINGVSAATNPEGSSTIRRTMKGLIPFITTNAVASGQDGFPQGDTIASNDHHLNETQINVALRQIWEQSAGNIDTIVVNGYQKRRINSFISAARGYDERSTRFRDLVGVYESDFGVCRVVLSRWMPTDSVLLLDSSRIDVLPLAGRSFHFKQLAATGDSEIGQMIGEYTLEARNENAHGLITGLATS